jgi:glycosyltransferase involved in cell wall biosynthesis
VVENGYDAADFPAPAPPPDAEAFRIAFVGSLQPPPLETAQRPPLRHRLNPLRRLRHAGPEALDRLPRQSPRFFLRGATAAVRERPALRDDLAIHFWGSVAEAEVAPDHLAALGLEANVFRHGPVPHGEAIRQMRAAQALLLTTDRRLDGRRSATVTGKLYEYMAARRPILVVGGDSDGADFAVRSGLGVHHLPEATDAIARTLLAWHDDWQGGQLTVRPREAFIAGFERRALTERLAGILDSVVRPPAHERTSA